jgi:hypothetical protein
MTNTDKAKMVKEAMAMVASQQQSVAASLSLILNLIRVQEGEEPIEIIERLERVHAEVLHLAKVIAALRNAV